MVVSVFVVADDAFLDALRCHIQGDVDETVFATGVVRMPSSMALRAFLASPPAMSARKSRASSSIRAL